MKKTSSEKSIEPLNSPRDEEISEIAKDENEIETDDKYLSWTKEECKKYLKSSDLLDAIKAHYRYGSLFEEEKDMKGAFLHFKMVINHSINKGEKTFRLWEVLEKLGDLYWLLK